MGTNYYAHRDVCAHCGRSDERVHIGKSSGGWPFLFHAIEDEGLTDWPTWKAWLLSTSAEIRDEYRRPVSVDDLEKLVTAKRKHAGEPHVARGYAGEARTADGDIVSWREFT